MDKKKLLFSVGFFILVLAIFYNFYIDKNKSLRGLKLDTPLKAWSMFVTATKNKNYNLALKCVLPGTEMYKDLSKEKLDQFSLIFQTLDYEIVKEEKIENAITLLIKIKFKNSEHTNFMWVPLMKYDNKYLLVDEEHIIKTSKHWETFETDHLIFHYEKRRFSPELYDALLEDEKINYGFLGNKKDIFPILEESYRYASDYLNVELKDKVDYYIVTSKIIFQLLDKYYELDDLPAGVAHPDKNRVVTFFAYNPHEIIHILNAKIGNPPTLLNEVFTCYIESKVTWKYNLELSNAKSAIKDSKDYVPLNIIFKNLNLYKNEPVIKSELFLFIDYLITTYSLESFKKLYATLNVQNYEEIFSKVYEKQLTDLEVEWKNAIGL